MAKYCSAVHIDVYELNRKAGARDVGTGKVARPRRRGLRSLALKYGLISRPGGR